MPLSTNTSLESGCAVWVLIRFLSRGVRAIFLAFYDARGAIIAQFPHHGIEERQHERDCGDAGTFEDESKDHGVNRSTVRAKLAVRGFNGYGRICRSGGVENVDAMTVVWN